jgi:hypothetical protein
MIAAALSKKLHEDHALLVTHSAFMAVSLSESLVIQPSKLFQFNLYRGKHFSPAWIVRCGGKLFEGSARSGTPSSSMVDPSLASR